MKVPSVPKVRTNFGKDTTTSKPVVSRPQPKPKAVTGKPVVGRPDPGKPATGQPVVGRPDPMKKPAKGALGKFKDELKTGFKDAPIGKALSHKGGIGGAIKDHLKQAPIGKAMAHKGGIAGAVKDHLKQAPIGKIMKDGLGKTISDARAKRQAADKAAKEKKGLL